MVQLGPKTSIGLAMLGATASIANFSYDASMINSLSIVPGYTECKLYAPRLSHSGRYVFLTQCRL